MNNAILTNIYSRRILIIRANSMKSINYFTSREEHLIIIIFRNHCLTICTLTNGRYFYKRIGIIQEKLRRNRMS